MRREPGKMAKALSGLGQDFSFDAMTGDVNANEPLPADGSAQPQVTDIFGTLDTSAQPAVEAGAFTPPPALDPKGAVALGIDLNKAVSYGGAIYKYIKQGGANSQTYVPQRVAVAPGSGIKTPLPAWALPVGLAALAFLFLRRRG